MTADPLLISLAQAYVNIVDRLHHGEIRHTLRDEMIDERGVLHEQLLVAFSQSREEIDDRPAPARPIVADARR